MSIDSNMEYYHIQLTEDASKLCIIISPERKYRYKHPPMVVCNSPEISFLWSACNVAFPVGRGVTEESDKLQRILDTFHSLPRVEHGSDTGGGEPPPPVISQV